MKDQVIVFLPGVGVTPKIAMSASPLPFPMHPQAIPQIAYSIVKGLIAMVELKFRQYDQILNQDNISN